jgi:hypothetical protein
VAKTAQGLKGRVLSKKFVFPIESWSFTFFSLFFCSWFCMISPLNDHFDLNVKILIFFKFFARLTVFKFLGQDPCQQKEF